MSQITPMEARALLLALVFGVPDDDGSPAYQVLASGQQKLRVICTSPTHDRSKDADKQGDSA